MPSRLSHPRGFSLIELSIVLLIAGLLIAGVFSVTSNIQKQRADQATANEVRTVITALERYLVDNQGALTDQTPGNVTPASLYCSPAPCSKSAMLTPAAQGGIVVKSHLGPGITDELSYFQKNYLPALNTVTNTSSYLIGIANLGPINSTSTTNTNSSVNLRGLVFHNPLYTVDDSRLARIAALIGAQGGMVPSTAPSTGPGQADSTKPVVQGVYGAWAATPIQYGFGAQVGLSLVAAYTATVDSQINTNLLSRINTGNSEANTMENSLVMNNSANPQDNYIGGNTPVFNDVVVNPPPTTSAALLPPAGAPNGILNAGGAGFLPSTATTVTALGPPTLCYTPGNNSGPIVTLYAAAYAAATPSGTNLSQVGQYLSGDPRLENMVVYGSANATSLVLGGAFQGGAAPTLLQCQYDTTSGNWYWQVAIPPTTRTWVLLYSPPSFINSPILANPNAWATLPSGTRVYTNLLQEEVVESFSIQPSGDCNWILDVGPPPGPSLVEPVNTVNIVNWFEGDGIKNSLKDNLTVTIPKGQSLYFTNLHAGGPICGLMLWSELR